MTSFALLPSFQWRTRWSLNGRSETGSHPTDRRKEKEGDGGEDKEALRLKTSEEAEEKWWRRADLLTVYLELNSSVYLWKKETNDYFKTLMQSFQTCCSSLADLMVYNQQIGLTVFSWWPQLNIKLQLEQHSNAITPQRVLLTHIMALTAVDGQNQQSILRGKHLHKDSSNVHCCFLVAEQCPGFLHLF